ncbi:inhibitory synaptic factor 1 isoform X1 [Cuculus canorus]|uniref:inhibitory synaptic factor 1 isoform X1 n=1 Tax=Cuculus canorus TaxID=55661 RepID=UPI0023AAF2BC|nr:inhibitory synaptic factor 1 isoform X1 [Cuculus canorus]
MRTARMKDAGTGNGGCGHRGWRMQATGMGDAGTEDERYEQQGWRMRAQGMEDAGTDFIPSAPEDAGTGHGGCRCQGWRMWLPASSMPSAPEDGGTDLFHPQCPGGCGYQGQRKQAVGIEDAGSGDGGCSDQRKVAPGLLLCHAEALREEEEEEGKEARKGDEKKNKDKEELELEPRGVWITTEGTLGFPGRLYPAGRPPPTTTQCWSWRPRSKGWTQGAALLPGDTQPCVPLPGIGEPARREPLDFSFLGHPRDSSSSSSSSSSSAAARR